MQHIRAKIYGNRLMHSDYLEIMRDCVAGRLADIELAAFLTACATRKIDVAETVSLPGAMIDVGVRLDWGTGLALDKHCVGGLPGNRTTPIVVAIVAACGSRPRDSRNSLALHGRPRRVSTFTSGSVSKSSINFLTSHDGFTLADVVSFAAKHNETNGENNRDGASENFSHNHGVEGTTNDAGINELRCRQAKNMLTTLMLSRGVPMLLGGDEFGRSQQGNNNAYCQDNPISWYDWTFAQSNADLIRFVRRLIELRRLHTVLRADRFYSEQEIVWLGPAGGAPNWDGAQNQLGCVALGESERITLLFNASAEDVYFTLPPALGAWRVAIDTGAVAPDDAPDAVSGARIPSGAAVRLVPHSTLVLMADSQ